MLSSTAVRALLREDNDSKNRSKKKKKTRNSYFRAYVITKNYHKHEKGKKKGFPLRIIVWFFCRFAGIVGSKYARGREAHFSSSTSRMTLFQDL